MADWDSNSPELSVNLAQVVQLIRCELRSRGTPSVSAAREWHRTMMRGLRVPRPEYIGRYRGEPGVEGINVRIGSHYGIRSDQIAAALDEFEQTLQNAVAALDEDITPGHDLNVDQLKAVIDLCAWVHAEWVRIHPLANGNGHMARLWVNYIAMRYGLPAFVRLRPRPDGPYEDAASEGMRGLWQAMVPVFRQMYRDTVPRRF